MLEFLQINWPEILAIVIAASGGLSVSFALKCIFGLIKKVKQFMNQTKTDIEITQNGIVEAFKKSKFSSEWKVSVSNQLDEKLDKWSEMFFKKYEDREELMLKLAIANTQILAYTAAFNKLTEAEKIKLQDLINRVSDEDITIEV